jgi:hypothetical protein
VVAETQRDDGGRPEARDGPEKPSNNSQAAVGSAASAATVAIGS